MSESLQTFSPDRIADCVLEAFDNLPQKCKPRVFDDGRREWVPLAGIVLSKVEEAGRPSSMICAALATGMKCLPQSKLNLANGNVIHDSHAEILAIRAFNRWLIDECTDVARSGFKTESAWFRWRLVDRETGNRLQEAAEDPGVGAWNHQPWALRDDVRIHMYCSEAPCGDASMVRVLGRWLHARVKILDISQHSRS